MRSTGSTISELENEKLVEYAALAESASSHPISKSLQRAYGKEIDRSRVTDVQEISGSGVIAKVDGVEVAAGNDKLMDRLGIPYIPCRSVGTIIHMAIGREVCRTYRHLRRGEAPRPGGCPGAAVRRCS